MDRLAGNPRSRRGSPFTQLQAPLIYGFRTDEQEECSVKSALSKIEDIICRVGMSKVSNTVAASVLD
jgi:hypothetical protein